MNGIIRKYDPYLDEEYFRFRHRSGLEVYVMPNKLATSYAILATRYGSFDNCFGTNGATPQPVPEGIAHFLEHKLFENSDGSDTFERFALHGANSNAYTTFDRTAYLFSSTEDHAACLGELLRFVYDPYFTPKTVKKEQGIIGEEIKMGLDSPSRARFRLLTRLLYRTHPISEDIAGSVESIAQITDKLLYRCYNTFYAPHNMILVAAGAFAPEEVSSICDGLVPDRPTETIERSRPREERSVRAHRGTERMCVAKPLFAIGFKDDIRGKTAPELLHRSLTLSVLSELLFGETSPFYAKMLQTNLADRIAASSLNYDDLEFAYVQGSAEDPEAVYREVIAAIDTVKRTGVDREAFARIRKAQLSDLVQAYNSSEEICELMLDCALLGCDPFEYAAVLRAVTPEDAEALLSELFDERYAAMAVIDRLNVPSEDEEQNEAEEEDQ